jgi:hypothetical protein
VQDGTADRDHGERFLRNSRSSKTTSWDWLGWLALVIGAAFVLFVLRRRRAPAPDADTEPKVEAPPFSFRSTSYRLTLERDGTAAWTIDVRESPTRATASQVKLARAVFPMLEDHLRDAAVRLLRTHDAWFEDGGKTAPALARELRVSAVRVPPDVKDATLYAHHAAFSGHIVEIGVSAGGRVTYVGLLG